MTSCSVEFARQIVWYSATPNEINYTIICHAKQLKLIVQGLDNPDLGFKHSYWFKIIDKVLQDLGYLTSTGRQSIRRHSEAVSLTDFVYFNIMLVLAQNTVYCYNYVSKFFTFFCKFCYILYFLLGIKKCPTKYKSFILKYSSLQVKSQIINHLPLHYIRVKTFGFV